MLTIASLALREAMRRRIAVVAAAGTLIVVLLSSWGLGRLSSSIVNREEALALMSVLTILLAFVFTVMLALGAASLAAPAISADVESGIVLSVLPRPLTRAEFVIGKWLGVAGLVAAYAAISAAVELLGIRIATGYAPPHPVLAIAYLVGESLVLVSLAILFSTRLPAVGGGLLAVLCFGVAWIAGIVGGIAESLHNDGVGLAATITSLIIPSDGLWHGAVFELQPVAIGAALDMTGRASQNPFGASGGPPAAFLIWTCLWVAGILALATVSFARRDV